MLQVATISLLISSTLALSGSAAEWDEEVDAKQWNSFLATASKPRRSEQLRQMTVEEAVELDRSFDIPIHTDFAETAEADGDGPTLRNMVDEEIAAMQLPQEALQEKVV